MQSKMAEMQEELAAASVTGRAGGGMVEVTLNGRNEASGVRIDPSAVDVNDLEMLEDLISAAINDAQKKLQELNKNRLSELTGGMKLPGGLNLPF